MSSNFGDAPDAQRWLAAIVDSSDDAIVGKRLNGTIVSWNAGATRIFGYAASEIIGRSILTLIPEELHHEEKHIISELTQGRRVEHFETERVRKDGTRVEVSLSVSPIRLQSGDIVGAAKIARDITEQKRLQRALTHVNTQLKEALSMAQQAQRDAEAANQVKSDFLATMSHELRTPLNAISGYADLMESEVYGNIGPEYRTYLERIRNSQRHLLTLISAVLDFSKLEAGRLDLHLAPVPVIDVMQRVDLMVTPQAAAKGQKFLVQRGENLLVKADSDRMLQILLNLAGNAVKFTQRGGTISLGAKATDDAHVAISVTDNGPGIAANEQVRIFEPFVQLDHSLKREHSGTGLGLAISRDLARAMGGDVAVESTLGAGATFTLTLPRG
jgi:two-component system sensor histidine kinase/response regulator